MPGGAPIGNQNGVKGARFRKALERVLARKYGDVDTGLEHLAQKFVDLAESEDAATVCRDIADRFDGRPHQAVQLSGDADAPLTINHKIG